MAPSDDRFWGGAKSSSHAGRGARASFAGRGQPGDGVPGQGSKFNMEQALESVGLGPFQYILLAACGLAWMADAMEIILLSFLLDPLKKEPGWAVTDVDASLLSASVFVGMLLAGPTFGIIGDRYGRRPVYVATTCITLFFGAVSALAPTFSLLLIARIGMGFGVGGVSVAYGLCSEMLPSATRGRVLLVMNVFWSAGAIFIAILAWIVLPTLGWRYLLAFASIPFALLFLFIPFIPESPRFLLVSGRTEEAHRVMQRVARWNGTVLPPGQLSLAIPIATNAKHVVDSNADRAMDKILQLVSPSMRSLTLWMWLIWGANSFVYYGLILITPHLMKIIFQRTDVFFEILITTLAELPGLLVAGMLIHFTTRARAIGIMLSSACISLLLLLLRHQVSPWITLCVVMLARMFITGAFATTYLFTPEIYPTVIRTTALGLCTCAARVAGIATPFIANIVYSRSHQAGIALYASAAFVAAVATHFVTQHTSERLMPDMLVGVDPERRNLSADQSALSDEETDGMDEEIQILLSGDTTLPEYGGGVDYSTPRHRYFGSGAIGGV